MRSKSAHVFQFVFILPIPIIVHVPNNIEKRRCCKVDRENGFIFTYTLELFQKSIFHSSWILYLDIDHIFYGLISSTTCYVSYISELKDFCFRNYYTMPVKEAIVNLNYSKYRIYFLQSLIKMCITISSGIKCCHLYIFQMEIS